jgi:hypothetical protein
MKIKKEEIMLQRICLTVLFFLSLVPGILAADESKVTGVVAVGGFNRYVFRGYEFSSHSAVLQPSAGISYRGFSFCFWGNIDTDEHPTQSFIPDRPGRKSFNESDLTLSYNHNLGKLSLTAGYIYYGTKFTAETEEIYGSISLDIPGKPTLFIYRDITSYPGTYFNFSLSHSLDLFRGMTLDLMGAAGFFSGDSGYWKTYESSTGGYTGDKYQAFHDGLISVGLTVPVKKSFSIQPLVQYWFPLSSRARKTIEGNSYNPNGKLDETWLAGINLKFTF